MTQEQRDEATKAVRAQRQLSRSYDPSLQNRVPTSQVPAPGTPARRKQIERFVAGTAAAAAGLSGAAAGFGGANLSQNLHDSVAGEILASDDVDLSGISGVSSPGFGQGQVDKAAAFFSKQEESEALQQIQAQAQAHAQALEMERQQQQQLERQQIEQMQQYQQQQQQLRAQMMAPRSGQ